MSRARVAVVASLLLVAMAVMVAAQPRELPLVEGRRALSLHGDRYGIVPLDEASVQRTRAVFDKVVRAAGRRPGLVLDLSVLDTPRVVGQALPGGQIVISRGLLDLTGGDDNALAFVVGHELALDSVPARSGLVDEDAHSAVFQALQEAPQRCGLIVNADDLAGAICM